MKYVDIYGRDLILGKYYRENGFIYEILLHNNVPKFYCISDNRYYSISLDHRYRFIEIDSLKGINREQYNLEVNSLFL